MAQYNIYVNPKPGTSKSSVIEHARKFGNFLVAEGLIKGFSLTRLTDSGNFSDMPSIQMINYFDDADQMEATMEKIKAEYLQEPSHAELMCTVNDFKVTFSQDC